jgi:hypothetical protein
MLVGSFSSPPSYMSTSNEPPLRMYLRHENHSDEKLRNGDRKT